MGLTLAPNQNDLLKNPGARLEVLPFGNWVEQIIEEAGRMQVFRWDTTSFPKWNSRSGSSNIEIINKLDISV